MGQTTRGAYGDPIDEGTAGGDLPLTLGTPKVPLEQDGIRTNWPPQRRGGPEETTESEYLIYAPF